jgi:hypothetical protein
LLAGNLVLAQATHAAESVRPIEKRRKLLTAGVHGDIREILPQLQGADDAANHLLYGRRVLLRPRNLQARVALPRIDVCARAWIR